MKLPISKTVDKYYTTIAKTYNQLHKQEQISKFSVIKKQGNLNGIILDVGAGTCISNKFFKNIINLDPSFEMLNEGKGMRVCGMAEFLPFKNNIFDGVISITALHHFDLGLSIKEMKRVSKINSKFSFSILKNSNFFDSIRKFLKNHFELIEINERKDLILISK